MKKVLIQKFSIVGLIKLTLFDRKGRIKDIRELFNLIPDVGFDFICDAMGNPTRPDAAQYCAVGSGTTAPASTDTALEYEMARVLGTYSHTTGTKVWTNVATFYPGTATGPLTEVGILNASAGGILLARQTYDVINKGAEDTLEVTWEFTLS